jgi:hypothetical protein
MEQLFQKSLGADARSFFISGSALNAGVFRRVCDLFLARAALPRIAVIPINLRSFSPTWDLDPNYQFQDEYEKLQSLCERRPASHVCIEPTLTAWSIYNGVPLAYPGEPCITLGEFRKLTEETFPKTDPRWRERAASIFTFHYMYVLQPRHRKLVDLISTVKSLVAAGTKVVCYVTPVNYEGGVRYVGRRFRRAVRRNVSVVEKELALVECRFTEAGSRSSRFSAKPGTARLHAVQHRAMSSFTRICRCSSPRTNSSRSTTLRSTFAGKPGKLSSISSAG